MKKLLFFLLALGAIQAKAQIIKGSIDMKDSTFNRSIPFEVLAGTKLVKYDIKMYAERGEVTVTLIDPNDKRSVNATVSTNSGSRDDGPSKGEIFDDLNPKIPGTWKFNFRASGVTGRISYQIEIVKL